jgi:alcohol dehydrogenase
VPESVTIDRAVFTEPLAAACEVLDQVRIPRGAAVAVLGDGKLGMLIAQVLKAHGAEVHLYGRHRSKLRIAESWGIETRRAGRRIAERIYDWSVDATGSVEGMREAVRMTRPRGTVILKSTVHGTVEIETAGIIVNEITLVGSRCGRFAPALRLLRDGKVRVEELVSEEISLEDAPRAFERAGEAGVLKVLLHPPG